MDRPLPNTNEIKELKHQITPKLFDKKNRASSRLSLLAALAFMGQVRTPPIYSLPVSGINNAPGTKRYKAARKKRNKLASFHRKCNI